MFKVLLVEDEVVVREGLRKNIPWEQCGFTCVGDASDGELALPMIRREMPDLLITDIKMPFMDGLALSRRVHQEFPGTKIIIISGYDDFQYAQQAIEIGVEQYLLKPLTKSALLQALGEVRAKLESEQEQQTYVKQFRQEAQEYEHFSQRRFFERLVSGEASVTDIYNDAQKLELELDAGSYNIVLYSAYRSNPNPADGAESYSDQVAKAQQTLETLFLHCERYILFRWSLTVYAVLVKGSAEDIAAQTAACIRSIRHSFEGLDDAYEWYIAAGEPVQRLSSLHRCFARASRILSYRHLCVGQHELTENSLQGMRHGDTETQIQNLDISKMSPEVLQSFLKNGSAEETEEFVRQYLASIGASAMESMLFCQYVMLNARFTAAAFVESIGVEQSALTEAVDCMPSVAQMFGLENAQRYITRLLCRAVELRETASQSKYHEVVRQGIRYIDQHFADTGISLNEVARSTGISANYFSALFSQELGCTFVEYLTQKRMERARELLRTSNLRTGEIAQAAGYKDAHYFSYLFKKTQGCTPRDYRAGEKK